MNKLCIVTGGANGIGEGIVRRLHHDGYCVVFCDIDIDRERIWRKSYPAKAEGKPIRLCMRQAVDFL